MTLHKQINQALQGITLQSILLFSSKYYRANYKPSIRLQKKKINRREQDRERLNLDIIFKLMQLLLIIFNNHQKSIFFCKFSYSKWIFPNLTLTSFFLPILLSKKCEIIRIRTVPGYDYQNYQTQSRQMQMKLGILHLPVQ